MNTFKEMKNKSGHGSFPMVKYDMDYIFSAVKKICIKYYNTKYIYHREASFDKPETKTLKMISKNTPQIVPQLTEKKT